MAEDCFLYHTVQRSDILKQIFTKQINELTSRFFFPLGSFFSELHLLFSCPQVETRTAKKGPQFFRYFEILTK